MKMKLTVYTDAHMFSKQVETKFEMLSEEYDTEKLIFIGMPLNKLPLNCDGLPLIVQKIYDYIVDYGLYEEYLFDDPYSNNERNDNIINAYELVSGLDENSKTIIDVDAVDVATVLVMWLYYLPEPLVSSKQFLMICDVTVNKNYGDILKSMDNVNRQTLQHIMSIVDAYEKQHKSHKEKLRSLFMLLLTKREDNANQNKAMKFIENLKTILMKAEFENNNNLSSSKCSELKTNLNEDKNIFHTNNLCNKKNMLWLLIGDEVRVNAGTTEADIMMNCNSLKKSNSSYKLESPTSADDTYQKLFTNNLSVDEENSKTIPCEQPSKNIFPDNSVDVFEELTYSSEIADMRSLERTMPTHSRSTIKRNKKKSIRNHAEKILKSGFLLKEDSLLLQNTLELMKLLSKIKSVQNQINIQRRIWEDEFNSENMDAKNKCPPDLHFLNNRLEQLVNQKNNYLSKTGLSYGRLYNRTVLNLKNAQKEAFKRYEDEKNNKKSQNENVEILVSDIYNIQIVLYYLENNCGGKELPWRSSRGCPGHRRKTKKQLNCVSVVSDLQTISEYEVMETIPQPLLVPLQHSDFSGC